MAPVIGKLTQAITMFTMWAQRPADPANTIAQQLLRELEACREQAPLDSKSVLSPTPASGRLKPSR